MSDAPRDGIAQILATGQFPGVIVRGSGRKGRHGNVHASKPGYNYSHLTPAQQEAVDATMMQDLRRKVEGVRRARRGTKRADGEVRHIGSLPLNLCTSVIREKGREAIDGPGLKQTLAENDCLFKS